MNIRHMRSHILFSRGQIKSRKYNKPINDRFSAKGSQFVNDTRTYRFTVSPDDFHNRNYRNKLSFPSPHFTHTYTRELIAPTPGEFKLPALPPPQRRVIICIINNNKLHKIPHAQLTN